MQIQPRLDTRGRPMGVTPDVWYLDYAKGFLGPIDPKGEVWFGADVSTIDRARLP